MNSHRIGAGQSKLILAVQVRARKSLLHGSVIANPRDSLQIIRKNCVCVRPALQGHVFSGIEELRFFRGIRRHGPYLPFRAIKLQECNARVVSRPNRLLDVTPEKLRGLTRRPVVKRNRAFVALYVAVSVALNVGGIEKPLAVMRKSWLVAAFS